MMVVNEMKEDEMFPAHDEVCLMLEGDFDRGQIGDFRNVFKLMDISSA